MRLGNLTKEVSERIRGGNMNLLMQVLSEELEAVKNDLVYLPEDTVKDLRGQAKTLAIIIKLLQNK